MPTRMGRALPGPKAAALVAMVWAGALAGCGGSGGPVSHQSPAARVCGQAVRAAASQLGARIHLRIAGRDPADIVCRLRGGRLHLTVEARASNQAGVLYDTQQVHHAQVYGPSPIHDSAELPHDVTGVGDEAFWVPAERQLYATNGSQTQAGSYLTVKVSGHRARGVSDLALASSVARAALAVAPRKPDPGPPPS